MHELKWPPSVPTGDALPNIHLYLPRSTLFHFQKRRDALPTQLCLKCWMRSYCPPLLDH